MDKRNFDTKKTIETLQEGSRNFYVKACDKAWAALREGREVDLLVAYEETGWCMVSLQIGSEVLPLTKKRVRQSDLKYLFGEVS